MATVTQTRDEKTGEVTTMSVCEDCEMEFDGDADVKCGKCRKAADNPTPRVIKKPTGPHTEQ